MKTYSVPLWALPLVLHGPSPRFISWYSLIVPGHAAHLPASLTLGYIQAWGRASPVATWTWGECKLLVPVLLMLCA